MKRNNLTTSVVAGLAAVAGFASTANAVELNPDGTGQVLVYPYYTVNKNQQTLVSVVNTTNIAKAVKVRFLEGHNSREVLDFNLFLSEFDVWTASVFARADAGLSGDGAAITTTDKSCTAPDKAGWTGSLGTGRPYQDFLPFAYTNANEDSGPTDIARTREGHIEIISMADFVNPGSLRTAVTHTSAGTPANCSVVQNIDPSNTQLLPPTGGLFGAGGVVNVAQGTFYTYNADAIDGFTRVVLFSDTASLTPSLAQANTAPGVATSYVFTAGGQLVRSDYSTIGAPSQAIDAVSAVFMSNNLFNEYNVDSSVGSNTDWVVTFPTKRFYVDNQILGVPLGDPAAIQPFRFTFGEDATGNGDGLSCAQIEVAQYDREEGRPVGPAPGFSPPPPGQPASSLCKEVNVISFLNVNSAPTESGVLGSKLVTNVKPFAAAGWMRLGLNPSAQPHSTRASIDGDVYFGLPATGFEAVNYVNSNVAPGVLSNYSGLFRHRASRSCTNGTAACS
ncbi:MAG: hypothetical protein JNN30_14565 [Rhodanobacteraceae bacterium]|nr:hypothetical protein [Rhodanobacteraceae bacterium]